ncbi:MAG: peptidase C39 family protein [Thermoplasmatota archaeon]
MVKGKFPLYKQSFGYSCGPASLLMVMGAMDENTALGLGTEVSIWEDANLGESRATSSYGLALAALRRGFKVKVRASGEEIGFTKRLKDHFPAIDAERMERLYETKKEEARRLGVLEERGTTTTAGIREDLDRGFFPIVLISTRLMREIVPIPHWVVVVEMDSKKVKIANPETAGIESYSMRRFSKHLGFDGYTCMVSILSREGRDQVSKMS